MLKQLWQAGPVRAPKWEAAGRRCQSQFSDMEVGSLVVKRRCDEVVENEL